MRAFILNVQFCFLCGSFCVKGNKVVPVKAEEFVCFFLYPNISNISKSMGRLWLQTLTVRSIFEVKNIFISLKMDMSCG